VLGAGELGRGRGRTSQGGPGRGAVGLFQQDGGAGTRLGQDPLASPLGVVGYFAAVGPGVGDAPFGGLLSLGQDADGLLVGRPRARAT
jgi:hypothetical protein